MTTPSTEDVVLDRQRRSAIRLTRMVGMMAVVLVFSLAAIGYLLRENMERVNEIQDSRYEAVFLRCQDDNRLKQVIRVLVPPDYPALDREPARSYLVVEGDCAAFAEKRLSLPAD